MSISGKKDFTLRFKDVKESKTGGVGFKNMTFAHQASAGDAGIDLSSIVTPSYGYNNPSSQDLLNANLGFYRENFQLFSSSRGWLNPEQSYKLSSSYVAFVGFTADQDEVFFGQISASPRSGQQIVDARPIGATGELQVGDTDFNVGTAFKYNDNPNQQVGQVIVYRNGQQQFRCIGNNLANEGNYVEMHLGNGLGQVIRFKEAAAGSEPDSIMVISNGLIAEKPEASQLAEIERINGAVERMTGYVAALAGVPENELRQYNPSNLDLKAFGDQVLDHENRLPNALGKTAYIKDVKASGTDGGTFTSGSYQTRVLNTLEDPYGIVTSLASNQFVLPAGTYHIEIFAPNHAVSFNKCKLRNITDSTDAILGQSADSISGAMDIAVALGVVTISSSKTFEVQHRCSVTQATTGFGEAASYGDNEVYTIVKITKVGV